MAARSSPVIAQHDIALVVCESAAVLTEILATIDLDGIHYAPVGDRAVILPRKEHEVFVTRVRQAGIWPKVDLYDDTTTEEGNT